jgi:hypothetical protein
MLVALVPGDQATDDAGDQLIFAADGFAAPDGSRDLDLVRDVLQQDETTSLDDSGYPILILVTSGELEIDSGGEPQTLAAGEAATFEGALDLTGAGLGETVFVAAVIGPDVPPPPRFAGTITLGVYACQSGATAGDLDNAADPDATGCDPVTAEFDISLLTAGDEEIPLADATVQADGVYTWQGLPFGDYALGDPSTLPDGYGEWAFYDAGGNPLETTALTIARQTPDVRVNLYLFAASTGSVTVRVINCPPGMTPETLAGDICEPAAGGFDITLELFEGDGQGISLGLDDATEDAGGFTWTGIELPASGDSRPLGIHATPPEGFNGYVVVGPEGPLEFVAGQGGPDYYAFALSLDAPSTELAVYNFQPGEAATGTVTMDFATCPAADSALAECDSQLPGEIALLIQGPEGTEPLNQDNAFQEGGSPWMWPELPFGQYVIVAEEYVLPEGYFVGRIDGTQGGSDIGYVFELSEAQPTANLTLVLVPEETAEATPPADDTDSDGLSDEQEAELGTDPTVVDTDGDCSFDGVEVEAGTDPLDPSSTANCG